eukprot:gene1717-33124_t
MRLGIRNGLRLISLCKPRRSILQVSCSTDAPPLATANRPMEGSSSFSSQTEAATSGREKLVCFSACHHVVPLPEGHRFPMLKYAATRENLATDGSLADKIDLRQGPVAQMRDLVLAHDEAYIKRFETGNMTEDEMRNVGFPYSKELVGRNFSSTGATVEATRLLFEEGRLMTANVAGGTHHAFKSRGEGFCVFNDIAVAAKVALRDFNLSSILVIDLDVHQGNGTAAIFEHEPRVTTFDVFGDKNYPWKTRMKNTYDVGLPDGTGDEEYLEMLRSWLPRLIETHKPQLVFFQAGVDALNGDSFGRLALTRQGLLQRNNLVYSTVLEAGVPTVHQANGAQYRVPH